MIGRAMLMSLLFCPTGTLLCCAAEYWRGAISRSPGISAIGRGLNRTAATVTLRAGKPR